MKLSLFLFSLVWSLSTFAEPSFDCARAQSKVEISICESDALARLDTSLAKAYKQSLLSSSDMDLIKTEQRFWLKEVRDACDDAICLEIVMGERLAQLSPPPVDQENSYKMPPPVADPLESVAPVTPKPEVAPDPPKISDSATATKVQNAPDDQAKPFLSDTVIFWMAIGFLVVMFITAIGIRKHANYFYDWFDFVISTVLTLAIITYLPNIFVALAGVVFCHIIVGSAINGFNFRKGLISSIGRCSGIFMLLGVMLASLIFFAAKMKTSNINSRISAGEDPMQAVENDRIASHSQAVGVAVGAAATGGVLYWIDSFFINNAENT